MAERIDTAGRRRFGDFVLDPASRELWRGVERLRLQPHVFQVLDLLTARAGEVVSREDIVQLLWPSRVVDFEAGLNSVIKRLRSVLGDDADAPRYVETLPRLGYRFIGSVSSPPADDSSGEEHGVAAHAPELATTVAPAASTDTGIRLHRIPPIHVFWAITGLLCISGFVAFATLRSKPFETRSTSPDAAAAALERTHSLAWAAYQRGRFLTFKHHVQEGTNAIAEFNRALELDPNLAEAWNGLAGVYISMAMFSTRDARELERKARDAAQRAEALRPDLADTHVIKGRIAYVFDWNWDAAEASYERALDLDPMNTGALLWLGMLDDNLGRVELAVDRLERAAQLDPASLQIGAFLCKAYVMAREYDHAVEQCRQALLLDETSQISTDWLAYAYELRGEHDKAVQTYLDFAHAVRDPEFADEIERFGRTRGMLNLRAKWARDELEEVASGAPDADVSPARLAWLRLWLGESHEVGPLLQKAYDQHDFFLVWLAMKPETVALADDPTYRALRARMRMPALTPAPETEVWARRFGAVGG